MDDSLLRLLEQSGFTEKESKVYLALLELGQGDVTDIAKIAGLKRSIIYVILESLIKRGHASQLPEGKVNNYRASDPSIILNKLKNTAKNFSEMLPILNTLSSKGKIKPKISYFDTTEAIWGIYEDMSAAKEPFFISNYHTIEKYFPGSVKRWVNDIKKGIYTPQGRHLIPDTLENLERGKEFLKVNQKVRSLKDLNDTNIDFTIWNNKLGITSLEEEIFIVVIESEELVKSLKPLFELAWQKGVELK